MNPYYHILFLVSQYEPCTRFYLEHLKGGAFKAQFDECISKNYLVALDKNENGDDLYYITDIGRKIVDNPQEELL